ncbi:MAG: hypothetical protein V4501_02425 [Pseudomonadota bacterium]
MQLSKHFVRYSRWLIFALLLISFNAGAYTILDTGIVTVVLPPGWKMKSIGRHKDIIATNYEKVLSKTESENLAEIQLGRNPMKPILDLVTEMSNRIKDQVTVEHCEVDPLKKLTVPDNMFNAWEQVIQCKNSESGIIQLYLDTDAKSIYLFTYTLPGYPFTKQKQSEAFDIMSTSIQVCYKGKPCYSFKA